MGEFVFVNVYQPTPADNMQQSRFVFETACYLAGFFYIAKPKLCSSSSSNFSEAPCLLLSRLTEVFDSLLVALITGLVSGTLLHQPS